MKKTGRDPSVLPRVVIYDPLLTLTLPIGMTVTSAINAIAHAAEGLYAHDGNPVIALMAQEGIRASAAALQPLRDNPLDLPARSLALYLGVQDAPTGFSNSPGGTAPPRR